MGGVYQGLGGDKPHMIILLGARGAKPPPYRGKYDHIYSLT